MGRASTAATARSGMVPRSPRPAAGRRSRDARAECCSRGPASSASWGTEILAELAPEGDDIVVPKQRYSGFFETDLDALLRRHKIESLIFTGCTTSVCVDSTLRDAFYRDYRCLLLSDCTGEPIGSNLARGNHEATLLVIETLFGWVSDSHLFLRALKKEDVAAPARV